MEEFVKYGINKVAACVPQVKVGDVDANVAEITRLAVETGEMKGCTLAVFPELCVTGYTCADLFSQTFLLQKALKGLIKLCKNSLTYGFPCVVVGAPLVIEGSLYNCAVVIGAGRIWGIVPKRHIPNYAEFYEKRWFASGAGQLNRKITLELGCPYNEYEYDSEEKKLIEDIDFGPNLLFRISNMTVGIEICEDLWVPSPPSSDLCRQGADIIVNLSATDENIGKHDYLLSLIRQQSARCRCAYVYASAGWGESSTDLVFSGNAIIAFDGSIVALSPRFNPFSFFESAFIDLELLANERMKYNTFADGASDLSPIKTVEVKGKGSLLMTHPYDYERLPVDPLPFVPSDAKDLTSRCEEITSIQSWGLMQRLEATGCRKAVIGISGGLDSTLALLITVKAFDALGIPRKNILAVTMPGFGTTDRTHDNAWNLMGILRVSRVEIPIGESVKKHFEDIGHDERIHDATYENGQARERTQILMDLANKVGGMVIGTGDLSELALGWCTYNGDQMSMYGVNASIPKTLVRYLVKWFALKSGKKAAKLLEDIIETPISPELIPANPDGTIEQKTEDIVGPYELHDFFLYHTLRNGFSPSKIYYLAKLAFRESDYYDVIKKWMLTFYRRFFSQQFKRSAMPDGPKVGSVCLSPRGDWRMPSDAVVKMWMREVENL